MFGVVQRGLVPCVALAVVACATPPDPRVVERRVATADGALFTRSGGIGPDLVLLHGLGDSSVGWHEVEDPLRRAGYRVTVVDALGAGRSDKPPEGDYRILAHVARLRHVLDELGIHRASFVANSLGGSIALRSRSRTPRASTGSC